MIDKKLDRLGRYIELIQKKESFDLIKTYINQINEKLKNSDNLRSDIEKDFENKIIKLINNNKEKGLSFYIISYNLYNILFDVIKKSIIEQKASELEIDKRLYKNEMRLLFKGRWE